MNTSQTSERVVSFESLVDRILSVCSSVRLVAVDGPGGSGKSVFADRLSRWAEGAPVIRTDDFASWEQPIDWWPRMLEQVVEPLAGGRAARYQRYDWLERRLTDWLVVVPSPMVIVEGVSSARSEWSKHLSFVVWIETDRSVRLRRGLERDGEGMRRKWEEWMSVEDRHFNGDSSRARADLMVDGAPTIAHEPESSFVAMASRI